MQRIDIKPFKLIGIEVKTTNENNQALGDIAQLWQRFMGEQLLEKIPHKEDNTIHSLYTDYEGDHTKPYTAILGCKVTTLNEIPDGMTGRTFDGGRYIKTVAKGDITKGLIIGHWTKIWEMGLDRAYTADFEAFGEKAQDPTNAEVEFYVAVKQ